VAVAMGVLPRTRSRGRQAVATLGLLLAAAGCRAAPPRPAAPPAVAAPVPPPPAPAAPSATPPPAVAPPAPVPPPPVAPSVPAAPSPETPPPSAPVPAPDAEQLADAQLAAQVEQALAADPTLRSAVIEAEVHAGQVTLKGVVPTFRERARAIELVLKVPGVKSVRPRLVLQSP